MEVAINAAYNAHDDAAVPKAEAQRALNSRERAIEALNAVSTYHHRRENGSGCVWGKHNSPTLGVLSDPWVADRLVDYSLQESGHKRHQSHTKTGGRPNLSQRDGGYWTGSPRWLPHRFLPPGVAIVMQVNTKPTYTPPTIQT
ncbi:hypothetical protein [Mycobacterium spongiae]|uniref:Uncharacterized protein n=1 Tax=Mycobacterium spongiae TaxID=886343 RepID=A0A975K0Z2_9MYCO|nr:hypothetical protein [Mycobacterium spongiae]QUR68153.1 hypothetical protein F6B93_14620 [Mycobacterium spongiae]